MHGIESTCGGCNGWVLVVLNEIQQWGTAEVRNSSERQSETSKSLVGLGFAKGARASAEMAKGTQLVCATRWQSGALYWTLLLDVE